MVWHRSQKNRHPEILGEINLGVLGKHNVLNALAAFGIALSLGISFHAIKEALSEFKHVKRRFDERYHSAEKNIRVIDDYGHHPTEIKAVLATAKQTGHSRIVTVFQPHRYTRTQLCWNEFMSCFQDTDVLLMMPIYAANEEPISGISSTALCKELESRKMRDGKKIQIIEVQSLQEAEKWVLAEYNPNDMILTLGAGSITKLADQLSTKII